MKTHLDLFSGIGGFALAASWAGFQTIGFCENEDFPRRLLSARFPGVPIHGDIRELDGGQYRGVSLITGGFPCQPFSVAGQQKGAADDRYLWPEMLRVIAQAEPDWVVAENVTGIVPLALDQVLSDLEGKGYACGTVVLPACAVDAPHRRDRVWIIAHASSQHLQKQEVVDAKTQLPEPGRIGDATRLRVAEWETNQPSMVGVAHGISHWVDRARGLGNAIVPQVAYEILKLTLRT